ncbi:MAG: gliding motility-associated protein GldE [Crocinitomicaceae bacterium]|nr:gliding motility-associated protein GldE [Crocinitomicaceae bacterium]
MNLEADIVPFIISILILLVLLLFSALISGSEVAFFSLGPQEIDELKSQEKPKKFEVINYLLERPKELLAIILISNNFINVGIVIVSNFVTSKIFPASFQINSPITYFILQVVLITFVILLCGEVLPKVYATKHAKQLARIMAKPLKVISTTFPFSVLKNGLIKGTDFLSKSSKKRSINVSAEELEHALEITTNKLEDEEERKLLSGIVHFGNTDCKQIMRARIDIVGIEKNANFFEVLQTIRSTGYSRIPVYEDSLDQIKGILYSKDFLSFLDEGEDFNWLEHVRPAMFTPENKKIDDLLKNFQSEKTHIAIVVDEYGGVLGLVTMEDILEEIVGDITDEFEEDEDLVNQIDENTYILEGKFPLVDFYKLFKIDPKDFEEAKGESETLAGFLIENSGKILVKNERVTFNEFTFTVEAADKRRLIRIKAHKNGQS